MFGHPGYKNRDGVLPEGTVDILAAESFSLWTKEPEGMSSGEVVFALRGTPIVEGRTRIDLVDDLAIVVGSFAQTDRAHLALGTLRAIEAEFPGYSITITGHSLGGTTALLLLAQDRHNNVIVHEERNRKESVIKSVYVYNPFKGPSHEEFYDLAFADDRIHGIFVAGDALSSATRAVAQRLLPPERLYVAPHMRVTVAHNIDGSKGSTQLTSPNYNFSEQEPQQQQQPQEPEHVLGDRADEPAYPTEFQKQQEPQQADQEMAPEQQSEQDYSAEQAQWEQARYPWH